MSSEEYDRWHATLDVDDGFSPWHLLARELLEPERDLVDKRVLEIGCGRGGFAHWLSEQGASVLAADFSIVAIRKARAAFAGSTVTWVTQDVEQLGLRSE